MARLFIGVLASEDVKNTIVSVQNKVGKFVDAKFVEKANFHISLSFLGETDDGEIDKISKLLDEICGKYNKFEVEFDEIKFIPSMNFLRVIAFDVKNETLKTISREIKTKIGGDVKPPHLTLCRVRKIIDRDGLAKVSADKIKFPVNSVCLIKSALSRYGPTYTVLHESLLG